MFNYAARLEEDPGGGFTVTFRDVPEAITQGDDLDDAMAQGLDALITAIDFYLEDGRQVPAPSAPQEGERLVEVPLSVCAKILLINAMAEARMRPADLASAMGTTRQEVHRFLNLRHTTKIDTLAKAFKAMGRNLDLVVLPA